MIDLDSLGLNATIILFVTSSIIVAVGGTFLTRIADRLADQTGLGEAFVGAILLGGVTSLSGIVTSVTAAYESHAVLSVNNALGGIAIQTVFLAIADLAYPKANLEHAAASLSNIMQSVILVVLLLIILTASVLPEFAIFNIHPATIVLLVSYGIGQKMIQNARDRPMWKAVKTMDTRQDIPVKEHMHEVSLSTLVVQFVMLGATIGIAGYFLAKSAIALSAQSGLSENFIGAMMTSLVSSLPELIVSVAAVRQGALTLAVSSIIGGNAFDILFVSFSDVAFLEGSIYHTFGQNQHFIVLLTLLLTATLTLGLLYRQQRGIGRIGWESWLVILLFCGGYYTLFAIL